MQISWARRFFLQVMGNQAPRFYGGVIGDDDRVAPMDLADTEDGA